ncbi:ABC-2 type transport system permease protein [Sphaerotilus hippei]|uniref:ABC-2 type transport system permease protein n=1 Tax=Sphaerotilus hippei TaxID=744406 RepID=A0A318H1T9_9BURK|nr:ABC transporter permease [Sphaerotilus hippei]PXW95295.1 ABC-2 type transport system permease protein [Sphaerotilus hippei]
MRWKTVLQLGYKELWALWRDPMLLILIGYTFTLGLYGAATSAPESLHKAPMAWIDEDQSQLSMRMASALYPPHFMNPVPLGPQAADAGLDSGRYTFALTIPAGFERDIKAGRQPELQLKVDATRMNQAFVGSGYVQAILSQEVAAYLDRDAPAATPSVELATRVRFNQSLTTSWFTAVMELINNVTMLTLVLTGAALIREREHGTIEHLLVMPVTPLEIMLAKVWAMGLVVLVASGAALVGVIQGFLAVPINGSLPLFLAGTALHLFACTALGIVMATVARSMPQFGLLLVLILLPLQMLSGGQTPRENMPQLVQQVMMLAPTTHYVALAQAILFRGAGFDVVWPQFAALLALGGGAFAYAAARFRRTIASMS